MKNKLTNRGIVQYNTSKHDNFGGMNMPHTLSVLVENRPGVLTRISGLISRRAFNIESIAAGYTEEPDMTRITIVVNGDDTEIE